MPPFEKMGDESKRIMANTEQFYEHLLNTIREESTLPRYMTWRTVNKTDYLYISTDGLNEKSSGRRSPETEKIYREFTERREHLKERALSMKKRMSESLAQHKALKLPTIMSLPARILREMDAAGLLGPVYVVIGTNAMKAYEIELGVRFPDELSETEDIDFSWTGKDEGKHSLLSLLRKVDQSFEVNPHGKHQAVNHDAYEVELLTALGKKKTFNLTEFIPSGMPGQEWLSLGTPVRHIAAGRDGTSAPIVAPDPRYFALHKIWLSEQHNRNPLKAGKDIQQGQMLLSALKDSNQYGLDEEFAKNLPDQLKSIWEIEMRKLSDEDVTQEDPFSL